MKKLLLGILTLISSVAFAQTEGLPIDTINGKAMYRYEVQRSEGLFRISKNFGVTQEELIKYNPTLQTEGLKLGQTIHIPVIQKIDSAQYVTHTLQPHETLYQLSRTYGVTVDDIKHLNPETSVTMRIGEVLLIKKIEQAAAPQKLEKPQSSLLSQAVPVEELPQPAEPNNIGLRKIVPDSLQATPSDDEKTTDQIGDVIADIDSALATLDSITSDSTIANILDEAIISETPLRIAYMLPFFTDATKRDASMDRFIDFYEGALIAIYEAQLLGQKFDIYAYDTRKEDVTIQRILQKSELQNMDAIIGPAYPAQVTYAAAFAKQNRVPLLVPFTHKVSGVDTNPYIWQFNPTPELEAAAIMEHLSAKKENIQFVFVDANAANIPQSIQAIHKAAADSGFNIVNTTVAAITKDSISGILAADKQNIFVFNSEKYSAVQVMLPNIKKYQGRYNISMIGHYSWSTSSTALPMIYTSVFHEPEDLKLARYSELYKQYFNHELSATHPRYDLLGYDMTHYLIQALARSQRAITKDEKNEVMADVQKGLTSDISFIRISETGGCINPVIQVIETK